MMHYAARQKTVDGLWHYCCNGQPVGYCSGFIECSTCKKNDIHPFSAEAQSCTECSGKSFVADPNSCPGHETKEGALNHYRDYLLDKTLQFSGDQQNARTLRLCEVPECKSYTSGSAWVGGYTHFSLCSAHRTRETVESLFSVGTSWES